MKRRGFLAALFGIAASPAVSALKPITAVLEVSQPEPLSAAALAAIREDLADVIWDICPMETPFVSTVAKSTVIHEWRLD